MHVCMYLCTCVCMYVCMHVCMYACMYVRTCVYVCMYVYVCVRMYVCMYVCMCVCMYVCMCVFMYVCMYVCMYACLYVCVYVCMYVCMCVRVHACIPNGGRPLVARALLPPGRGGGAAGPLGGRTPHAPEQVVKLLPAAGGSVRADPVGSLPAKTQWHRRGPAWSPRRGAQVSGRIGPTRFCTAQAVAAPGAYTGG